ncbi:hypothetical protein OVY48_18390 [Sphingobium sp. SA2]|uniref:hypothetical protein n=1 Tax=Sphingobium sp. SA2 TaxID=1524832 RepID=UPI0028C2E676|nr:hypothetical protein [Sphingobium sp. SA2]MDT7535381.1 hypothetical protein [Sphingobium sp. SA2]
MSEALDADLEPGILKSTIQASKRMEARRTRVCVKVEINDRIGFTTKPADGFHPKMMPVQVGDAFGTTSQAFVDQMMGNLATYFHISDERRATRDINAALAVLDGMKPDNEVEAMLLTQMVATNDAAMRCLATIGDGLNAEMWANLATKLMRTFTAQTEALAKLRRKGEQTVKVVHVYPGGQAVVGDVHHHRQGEGVSSKREDQSYGAEEPGTSTALPSPDPFGNGVPIPSRKGKEAVPNTRREQSRRANGKSERS